MFALDANILVYTHNLKSSLYPKAKEFVERVVAETDAQGDPAIGIPLQAYSEFINVITRFSLEKPLSVLDATKVVRRYVEHLEIPVITPKSTQLQTFLTLLSASASTSRKRIFDIFLAATLKNNEIEGLYTANIDDFKDFTFLKVVNPFD